MFSMQYTVNSSKGYSLLEVALTLPILFVFIIGAIDVNTSLQGYSAVREGIRTANRCTWATDGDCTEVSAPFSTSDLYYNYEVYQPGPPSYIGHKFSYSGNAHHLLAPVYRLSNFRAEVLDSIQFDQQIQERDFRELAFPAEGTTPIIYQARLPRLNITRIPGGRPSITATYRADGEPWEELLSYSSSGSVNLQWSDPTKRSGSITFRINRPAGNGLCRKSTNFNGKGGHDAGNTNCSQVNGYHPNKVEAVVMVYGNDGNSANSSEGDINMSISGPGFTNPVSLGGRHYFTGNDASLCPRVPNLGDQGGAFVSQSGCSESDPGAYSKFGALEYDQTYTLNFSLQNITGDLHWNFESLRLYLPRIKDGWNNWRACQDPVTPSQFEKNNGCRRGNGDKAKLVRWKNEEAQPHNGVSVRTASLQSSSNQEVLGISSANCGDASTALGAPIPPKECINWYEFPSSPGVQTVNASCGPNYGRSISAPSSGNTAATVNIAAAVSECDTTVAQSYSANATNVITRTKSISLPSVQDVSWERSSCADNSPPIPSAVSAYQWPAWDESFEKYSNPIDLGKSVDPRELLSTSAYSCSYQGTPYSTAVTSYNEDTTTRDFFKKVHFDFEMGCDENEWQEATRQEAIQAGMSRNAYFEAEKKTTNESEQETEQDIVATISKRTFEEYSDTACLVEMIPGQPDELVATVQGNCDNTYESAPVDLVQGGEGLVWVKQVGGFCGLQEAEDDANLPTVLENEAKTRFYSRVQMLYPAAQLDCDGDNCVRFGPPAGVDPNDRGTLAQWEGSIQVPLLSAQLVEFFAGSSFSFFDEASTLTLRSEESRTFESELTR